MTPKDKAQKLYEENYKFQQELVDDRRLKLNDNSDSIIDVRNLTIQNINNILDFNIKKLQDDLFYMESVKEEIAKL